MRLTGWGLFISAMLSILWGAPAPSRADDPSRCAPERSVNLTQEAPLSLMRPFQQNLSRPMTSDDVSTDTNLCHAIVASQISDFIRWRREHDRESPSNPLPIRQTSPLFTAALYRDAIIRRLRTDTPPAGPLSTQLDELALNPDRPARGPLRGIVPLELFKDAGNLAMSLDVLFNSGSCLWPAGENERSISLENALALQCYLPDAADIGDFLGPQGTCNSEGAEQIGTCFSNSEIRNQILRECSDRTPSLPNLTATLNNLTAAADAFPPIHESLDNGYPIGVSVCYQAIRKPSPDPRTTIDSPNGIQPGPSCSLHSIMVVGRRYNARLDTCEYLVRDSYPHTVSRSDSSGNNVTSVTHDIWIPESRLSRHIIQVFPVNGLY